MPCGSLAEQHATSGLGVSVPVCAFGFSSVLQASISTSCLGVSDICGLGDLLFECLLAAAGVADGPGPGFSFLADAHYPTQDLVEFILAG